MADKKVSRRSFLKTTSIAGAGLALSAKSYGMILGANDRVNFAIAGLNGRGNGLIGGVALSPNTQISYFCDVDERVYLKAMKNAKENYGLSPKTENDFRKLLENQDVDVLVIATPDHWHAPMSILALEAGKHVYVEKPCSHNPREGELLIAAQKKYKGVIQMGNQQRSASTSIEAIRDIRNGLIGEVYFGKAWYANSRGSIGKGRVAKVPENLDWDLWQGPAPRRRYKDNRVHYNWHWFWDWGTGEINNNGTHEIDICRWALDVDFPTEVNSSGGRYHFDDDWEFYDTQVVNYQFPGNKMITWEGRSCNPFTYHGRGRGASIHGTKGTIILDRNGYLAYGMDGKVIKDSREKKKSATTNTVGIGNLDILHMTNMLNVIRKNEKQHSPIDEGHKSNLLCHLGNIAQEMGRVLKTNPRNGKILNDRKAMKMWSRDYESGWEPKV